MVKLNWTRQTSEHCEFPILFISIKSWILIWIYFYYRFPFSGQVIAAFFVLLFSIIIMNLLFGLAVADIQVRQKLFQ